MLWPIFCLDNFGSTLQLWPIKNVFIAGTRDHHALAVFRGAARVGVQQHRVRATWSIRHGVAVAVLTVDGLQNPWKPSIHDVGNVSWGGGIHLGP